MMNRLKSCYRSKTRDSTMRLIPTIVPQNREHSEQRYIPDIRKLKRDHCLKRTHLICGSYCVLELGIIRMSLILKPNLYF